MISTEVAVEPAKEAAVLVSVVVAAADGGEMAADVDKATNASHMRTTLILLTPTGILLRTPDKWERLGSMRSYVLQLQDGGRGGGRGRSDQSYQSYQGSNTNRTTSSVSATNTNSNDSASTMNVPADQLVVFEISVRGS
jgi:hypothetical protein